MKQNNVNLFEAAGLDGPQDFLYNQAHKRKTCELYG